MTKFAYYNAGLHLADFVVTPNQLQVQAWDAKQPVALDDAQDAYYVARMGISPKTILSQWQRQDFTLPEGDSFTTTWGADYQQADAHYWLNRKAKPAVDLVVADQHVIGFQITVRNANIILATAQALPYTAYADWQNADMLQKPLPITKKDVTMAMPDGVKLAATVILPAGDITPRSTILTRTPYGRQMFVPDHERFAHRGYAVVCQDVRGREDSQGQWQPMQYEKADGDATLDWIAAQPWSNGRVGMIGGSYGGYVQWAAAASGNPHLQALVSMVTAGGPFTDVFFHNGVPNAGIIAWYFAVESQRFTPEKMVRDDWDQLLAVRPLTEIPVVGLGHHIAGWDELRRHQVFDDWLQAMDWQSFADKIKVPALIQSGWFDDDGIGTTEALRVTAGYPAGARKVILGPWLHGGNAQYDVGPIHLGPSGLRHDIDLQHMRWFDHQLNHVQNGIDQEAPVDYYTVNSDEWKTADNFPPSNTTATTWYLDPATAGLQPVVGANGSQQFDYDPKHPTPQLISVSDNEFETPNDYAQVEQGPDVTSFTSPVLAKALTITGWFDVDFYASSSAVNTDWAVRLVDVTPDDRAINIADMIMNATHRDGLKTSKPLVPGDVYRFHIQTQKTSYKLLPGHALRLDFASAMAGLTFPNSNLAAGYDSKETVIAHQTIYGGKTYPSAVHFTVES
ncbi:CocE/NonD family hydrolase [Lacticaseibacillus sp. N501-2]|uniref:CocE/NonD family hydrolase n=1 Tax=Lacticaseibacillus salsurae TaxID=3367729 RepID=UPI0038B258A8